MKQLLFRLIGHTVSARDGGIESDHQGDPNLRSFQVVRRYQLASSIRTLGRCCDVPVDDDTRAVHRLIVRLRTGWRRKTVMASPHWVNEIDWLTGIIWTETPLSEWEEAPAFSWRHHPRFS